ncbi:curli production assembly/transport component CsgG [Undibacterium sp. CY18W]|uniref:Curli production assembly/transport component CsgG n=1 Tax=Undibacterium hunanense TaxID=2762292 RepID=A0ABR6ZXI4_9BURK|nr:CsgG/HfaB family protein [Undibacterium hunanense]MBC3920560.1 curli production assembly/transport component CsgG [Undibacterium hunanense]
MNFKIQASNKKALFLLLSASLFLAACGEKKTELGEGSSEVTGAAGPAGAKGASKSLVKCDAPVATLSLVENPNGYVMSSQYNLPSSPVPLIRLLAQQSGCFRVVDRSSGLKAVIQEQELKDQGIIRKNSTVAKGKGYEAQYTLTPSLTFSESKAGGGIGAIMGMIPILKNFTGYAEKVSFKEAQVALLLTDNETTEQLAASTGSAKSTDLGMGGLSFGAAGGGFGAGWSNTNEAKVIVAAFLDAHNKLVPQIKQLQEKELPPAVPVKK